MNKFTFTNKQQEVIVVEFNKDNINITNENGTRNFTCSDQIFSLIEGSAKHNTRKTWQTINDALNETFKAAPDEFLGNSLLLQFYTRATCNVITTV